MTQLSNVTRSWSGDRTDLATHYVQQKPYNTVLPYQRAIGTLVSSSGTVTASHASAAANRLGSYAHEAGGLRAIAGERVLSKARDGTALAETMAELGGALTNVAVNTGRVLKSYKLLRKGKFRDASRALGLSRERTTLLDAGKSLADKYLAWNFAVLPTLDSISSSVEFLQSPAYRRRVHGGSQDVVSNNDISTSHHGIRSLLSDNYRLRCYTGTVVEVTNPNLALADSFGFTRPHELAWELTPGSFLLDYFVPIGDFLGSFSPLMGRRLLMPFTTIVGEGTFHKKTWNINSGRVYTDYTYNVFFIKRWTGIRSNYSPPDVLRMKLPPLGAADTTVALAVKTFSK